MFQVDCARKNTEAIEILYQNRGWRSGHAAAAIAIVRYGQGNAHRRKARRLRLFNLPRAVNHTLADQLPASPTSGRVVFARYCLVQHLQQGEIAPDAADFGRHRPFGRIAPYRRQLNTFKAEFGGPVRQVGEQFVGHENIPEWGHALIHHEFSAITAEALRSVGPAKAGKYAQDGRMYETNGQVP